MWEVKLRKSHEDVTADDLASGQPRNEPQACASQCGPGNCYTSHAGIMLVLKTL